MPLPDCDLDQKMSKSTAIYTAEAYRKALCNQSDPERVDRLARCLTHALNETERKPWICRVLGC